MIKVGCCGFPTAMKKYFQLFNVVEVQKTFYRPPKIDVAKKWRESAPDDFEFTLKAWQVITHPPNSPTYRKARLEFKEGGFFRPIKEVFEAWEVTKEVAEVLNARVIVFQTPRSFKDCDENIKNMKEFFSTLERKFLFCFEPRGWKAEKIKEVCRDLNLIHIVDPTIENQLYGDISYFRLHGIDYKHAYSDEELVKIRRSCKENSYVMFNNMSMLNDALRFKDLLKLNL